MKKLSFNFKIILTIIIVSSFLVMTGCQPEGGELLPIGGEDIEIATMRFENDTAVIIDNGIKIKFYGTWSGNNYIHLRVALFNESNRTSKIKFDKAVLKNENEKVWKISTINEKPDLKIIYGDGNDKDLPIIDVGINERKSFVLEFAPLIDFSSAEEAEKTLYFILPIEVEGKTEEYKVQFEIIGTKDKSGKSDPQDW